MHESDVVVMSVETTRLHGLIDRLDTISAELDELGYVRAADNVDEAADILERILEDLREETTS